MTTTVQRAARAPRLQAARTARAIRLRLLFVASVVAWLAPAAHAATGGAEPPEPVNVITETGRDIGPCPAGGALAYPAAPYKGIAYFLRQASPELAARHGDLTRQRAPWLQRLEGPSGANRLYTGANGDRAIVFWSCQARDCAEHIVYGAYALQSHAYALQVRERGSTARLGSDSSELAQAIACAQSHDTRLRDQVRDALKKPPGR